MKKTEFDILCDLKLEMKQFMTIENELHIELDLAKSEKEHKAISLKLKRHISSFKQLEADLVKAESKMIDLDRGLYKGVAINVRDKTLTKIPLYLKFANINNHVGYTGTTRVGKTKNMISDADQLIKKGWDVFIVDPKGGEGQEILTEIIQSTLMAKRPEDFKYISPAFPNESEYVNLLYGMADDEGASLIKTFAESVSDDGFFSGVVFENTLAALKALTFIQHATDPDGDYTKSLEEKEMLKYLLLKNTKDENTSITFDKWNRVLKPNELHISTAKSKKASFYDDTSSRPSKTLYQNRSMVTFKTLSKYTTYESFENLKFTIETLITVPPVEKIGNVKYLKIVKMREEALSLLEKVLSTDELNFSKIAKTHSVLLSQLVYGDIGDVFSGVGINTISNRLLSEDMGLVCVMQPYPMKYKTISNVSVMAVLKTIESMMGLVGSSGRANKRRLAIMIDEAGAVMYRGIADLFNKAGGLGVTMFVYTQSPKDYALALDDINAKVIADNINTPIQMKMNDLESCKVAAESLGTVRKHQSMYMSSANAGGRFSVGNEDENIAEAEHIYGLPIGTGYLRHLGETYIVDFPYVKGVQNSPLKMPTLESETSRRNLAMYESELLAMKEY